VRVKGARTLGIGYKGALKHLFYGAEKEDLAQQESFVSRHKKFFWAGGKKGKKKGPQLGAAYIGKESGSRRHHDDLRRH